MQSIASNVTVGTWLAKYSYCWTPDVCGSQVVKYPIQIIVKTMDSAWISKVPAIDQSVIDLHNKLHQQVVKPGDNAEEIIQVLDKHGFHQLSEGTKLYLLCAELAHTRNTVFEEIFKADKINTLIALLPLTPLFGIAKNNIPEYKWIESPTWMENTLYENKLRWKPGGCKCRNHNQPSNGEEKLCAVTNIAFTMFAAELFFLSDVYSDNQQCLLYLLIIAPGLLSIKVPRYNNETQLKNALRKHVDNPYVLDILIEKVSPIDIVVAIPNLGWTWRYYSDTHYSTNVRFLIETVAKGHENEIRQYRDNTGSSVLHIVCYFHEYSDPDPLLLDWLNLLLRIGLDPSVRNKKGESALDVLITSFCWKGQYVLAYSDDKIDISHFMARSFIQAIQMFLPWFKDTPVSNITLPELRSTRYPSVESINIDCINLYQTILDKGVFRYAEQNLSILYAALFRLYSCDRKHNPCIHCKLMVRLTYQALHNGIALQTTVMELVACGTPVTMFDCLVNEIKTSRQNFSCSCQSNSGRSSTTCGCCGFQVMELIAHCTPHIKNVQCCKKDECGCFHISLMNMLLTLYYTRPFTMSNICNITKLIWLYFPEDKIRAMDYLHMLHDGISSTDDSRVVSDLQDLMQTVRPLKLLCRLCILQLIHWKDIKRLPAPMRLIRYLELGDISSDHVVHSVL